MDIEDIPSPWLTGIQDEFFDGKLAPMIETNRGCPFTCTFCVQGVRKYTRRSTTSRWIASRRRSSYIGQAAFKSQSPNGGHAALSPTPTTACIERDIEISALHRRDAEGLRLADIHQRHDGKEQAGAHHQVGREGERRAWCVYQAVQSHRRGDCCATSSDREHQHGGVRGSSMIHVRGRGLRSLSDLILGLPGETLQLPPRGPQSAARRGHRTRCTSSRP